MSASDERQRLTQYELYTDSNSFITRGDPVPCVSVTRWSEY